MELGSVNGPLQLPPPARRKRVVFWDKTKFGNAKQLVPRAPQFPKSLRMALRQALALSSIRVWVPGCPLYFGVVVWMTKDVFGCLLL